MASTTPVPTPTTALLAAHLASVASSHQTTQTFINRLADLPGHAGADDDDEVRAELSREIQQRLKELDDELDVLRQEIDDDVLVGRDRGREALKAQLLAETDRLVDAVRRARTGFRKAQLQAKRTAERARLQARDLLFAGVDSPSGGVGGVGGVGSGTSGSSGRGRKTRGGGAPVSQDELELDASGDVTAALRRTHQMLQGELSRSQFAHDTLQQSSEALQTLSESYSRISTLLTSSRSLLSSLLRSQKSDTWYLETAFYVLAATIVWLVFRRFVYGPLWWLVWFPLKLAWRASSAVAAALLAAAASSSASSSSTASALSTTARPSLITHSSATGAFPTWATPGAAPSIAVGGGGKGAPLMAPSPPPPATAVRPPPEEEEAEQPQPQPQPQDDVSMVEAVRKMVEASGSAEDAPDPPSGRAGPSDGDGTEPQPPQQQQQPEQPQQQAHHPDTDQAGDTAEAARKPNPKKRMWEEDKEAQKNADRSKDEL
ncbi:MAG: hypothetical protein M1826_004402 [Phylliscum demangeonii]|nr:MAG: hypothetical protein M1826_004402 [Phylliscum demangeonii]